MIDFSIPRFPALDFNRAREIAEQLLRQYGYVTSRPESIRLPVNVENLAARVGHPVNAIEGLQSEFDMRGLVFLNPTKSRLEIVIDAYHYESQPFSSPFTIAEELAHIVLHRNLFEKIHSPDDRIKLAEAMPESTHRFLEMTAKRLASELMLPDLAFRPFVHKWCSDHITQIREERPIDRNDLLLFMRGELGRRLALSESILERALTRPNTVPVVDEVIDVFKVSFLSGNTR